MVLESIINPKKAEEKPWQIFFISILFSAIAIFLAYNLFPNQSSILSIAFLTIFFVPFFQRLFSFEERKDESSGKRKRNENFIARHRKIVYIYTLFFLGVILTYSFAFVFIPDIRDVFTLQIEWFRNQGLAAVQQGSFEKYFFNNTQVMMLFFVLSVLFGAGAVFILTWNASVIAIFVGIISNKLSGTVGITEAYIYGVSTGLASIALHGIPEILGYFFAGIAGGILSIGLLREKFMSESFKEVFKDSLVWLVIGETLIILGAILEALF